MNSRIEISPRSAKAEQNVVEVLRTLGGVLEVKFPNLVGENKIYLGEIRQFFVYPQNPLKEEASLRAFAEKISSVLPKSYFSNLDEYGQRKFNGEVLVPTLRRQITVARTTYTTSTNTEVLRPNLLAGMNTPERQVADKVVNVNLIVIIYVLPNASYAQQIADFSHQENVQKVISPFPDLSRNFYLIPISNLQNATGPLDPRKSFLSRMVKK